MPQLFYQGKIILEKACLPKVEGNHGYYLLRFSTDGIFDVNEMPLMCWA